MLQNFQTIFQHRFQENANADNNKIDWIHRIKYNMSAISTYLLSSNTK